MSDRDPAGHTHAGPDGAPGHAHPHAPDDPTGRPRIGFIGAGRVASVLAVAFRDAGWPVVAFATRDPGRAARFASLLPAVHRALSVAGLADEVDLIFVTVPDDALPDVATTLRLYAGQAAVHTSGALAADVLEPARAAGTSIGSFHPLVAFADQEAARAALVGATVALEGDEGLVMLLARLATDIGAQPVLLPPAGKQAYHAAAVLAAGGFVGLLDAIAEVSRGAGLDEAGALAIYAPLIRQSLSNAEQVGIARALTGPFVRGDVGTVQAHLAALARLAPGALELYRAAARREVAMATARGELDTSRAAAMMRLLDAD